MASPFNVFRKRQKLMLAILGVLAMVAFVVLPPLMQSQGPRAMGSNPEVARTKYGVLLRSDVDLLLRDQAIARSFVEYLAEAADDRFLQFQMKQRWGEGGDERFAVQRMLLAKKAEEMGMAISNAEVQQFIRDLTDDSVTRDQLAQIFGHFDAPQAQVLDALRRELLADRLQTMFVSYFSPGEQLIATPAEQWEYYQRLNRRVQAEVAALPTARFVDEVSDPSEEVLQAYFDEYADRLPSPLSPEPGFRVPLRAAFTYLKADFDKAVEGAEATDEEVAAYYEENREFYKNPELPFPEEGRGDRSTLPDFRLPTPPRPDEGYPEDLPAGETDGDLPTREDVDSAEAAPASDEGAAIDAADQPAVDEADEGENETDGGCQPADETDNGPAETDELAEAAETTATEQAEEGEGAEEPSDEASDASETLDAGGTAEQAGSDAPPDDEASADDDLPVREDLAGESVRPAYKPLSEVEDQIRNSLKRRKAAEQLDEAVRAVMEVMNDYYAELLVRRAGGKADPPLPDLVALAAAHNMTLHETGLLSQQEVFDQVEIGKSFYGTRQPIQFTQYAYHSLQEFQPGSSQDDAASRFVFWKTEQKEERAGTLADAETRRHVTRTWKLEQARELARQRAEELAEQASKSGGSLAEALAGEPGIIVAETGEFTWMTDPFQQGQPRLSEVDGVEHAGPDFMQSVFALAADDVGIAWNQPQDTVYVVRAASMVPSTEVLRTMFASTEFRSYRQVAVEDFYEVLRDWATQIQEDAELDWLPQEESVASR